MQQETIELVESGSFPSFQIVYQSILNAIDVQWSSNDSRLVHGLHVKDINAFLLRHLKWTAGEIGKGIYMGESPSKAAGSEKI